MEGPGGVPHFATVLLVLSLVSGCSGGSGAGGDDSGITDAPSAVSDGDKEPGGSEKNTDGDAGGDGNGDGGSNESDGSDDGDDDQGDLDNQDESIAKASCSDGEAEDGVSGQQTGRFVNTPIEGLNYRTETLSGTTGAEGTFQYLPGETITFTLGDLALGETVPARAEMTALCLVPDATLYTTTAQVERVLLSEDRRDITAQLSFYRFANLLTFLYSLDGDGDPDNGIRLHPDLHTLFVDVDIDFEQDIHDFRSKNYPFKGVSYGATAAGLLETGELRNTGRALDHFYSAQGISHRLALYVTRREDREANGTIDRIFRFSYNSAGDLLSSHSDFDNDGVDDQVRTFTYDQRNHRLTEAWDKDGDGIDEEINTYTYDLHGNKVAINKDRDNDGTFESLLHYDRDNRGRLLKQTSYRDGSNSSASIQTMTWNAQDDRTSWSIDTDGDGTRDVWSSYTYDSQGNRLSSTRYENGNKDTGYTYTYSAEGLLLVERYDRDGDDIADEIKSYTYDAEGYRFSTSTDYDADGVDEFTRGSTFSARGARLTDYLLAEPGGVLLDITRYSYDSAGRLRSISTDSGNDGTTDYATRYTYDNESNRLTETEIVGGNTVRRQRWTYDAEGNALSEDYDIDGDGRVDGRYFYTYAPTTWRAVLKRLQ